MHDGRITSEAEFIRDVSGSETGVEGGMTTVNTDLYTPEVVLQLDEECPQHAHSGTPEVVRNSAVGRRDVNEVIDELKEETVCEGRTWSRRSSYEAGSHGNVLEMHEKYKVIKLHEWTTFCRTKEPWREPSRW